MRGGWEGIDRFLLVFLRSLGLGYMALVLITIRYDILSCYAPSSRTFEGTRRLTPGPAIHMVGGIRPLGGGGNDGGEGFNKMRNSLSSQSRLALFQASNKRKQR